jgi:Uma2 family endonuclease
MTERRIMPKTMVTVGPEDHLRRMSLAEFDRAEGQPGYIYELSRAVVIVCDVPNRRHLAQVHALREQFYTYYVSHREQIHTIATGSDCKILLWNLESERHPDLAICKNPPAKEDNLWSTWIPDLVIEVSPGSEERDYVEKREEYLSFKIKEYWIIDAEKREMLVLSGKGKKWKEQTIQPPSIYESPLLPGLKFDCAPVFQAADAVKS